jgi:hypothetical protein
LCARSRCGQDARAAAAGRRRSADQNADFSPFAGEKKQEDIVCLLYLKTGADLIQEQRQADQQAGLRR